MGGCSGFSSSVSHADIDHLNAHGKDHCKVNITFWNILGQTLEEDHKSDKYQKTQGKHFHRRVFMDKVADPSGKDDHDADRDNNRNDHDNNVFSKSDGREDRVERKNDVKEYDLCERI